jgi:hypothetical protein
VGHKRREPPPPRPEGETYAGTSALHVEPGRPCRPSGDLPQCGRPGSGGAVSLPAYLQLQSKAGLAGKQLEFQFNGGSWTPAAVVTDAVGKATVAVSVTPASAGSYPFTVGFTADAEYNAGTGAGTLTIAP